jgi:hypothetical protein
MGIGASLALMAVGAILAFATRFRVAGIDVQMIGWILMIVGAVGMYLTFRVLRGRRRVVADDPIYLDPDERLHPRPAHYPDYPDYPDYPEYTDEPPPVRRDPGF